MELCRSLQAPKTGECMASFILWFPKIVVYALFCGSAEGCSATCMQLYITVWALAIPENHVVSFVLLLCELAGNFQSNIPAARAHVAVHRKSVRTSDDCNVPWQNLLASLQRSHACWPRKMHV